MKRLLARLTQRWDLEHTEDSYNTEIELTASLESGKRHEEISHRSPRADGRQEDGELSVSETRVQTAHGTTCPCHSGRESQRGPNAGQGAGRRSAGLVTGNRPSPHDPTTAPLDNDLRESKKYKRPHETLCMVSSLLPNGAKLPLAHTSSGR